MERARQHLDILLASLEEEVRSLPDPVPCFCFEVFDKKKQYQWLFKDKKVRFRGKSDKSTVFDNITGVTLKVKVDHSIINDLIHGKVKPAKALLTGKVSYEGNPRSLASLRPQFSVAIRKTLQYLYRTKQIDEKIYSKALSRVSGPAEMIEPSSSKDEQHRKFVDVGDSNWEKNENVSDCRGCSTKFGFIKRKHHCRLCGKIFCSDCCSFLVNKHKSCRLCYEHSLFVSEKLEKQDFGLLPTGGTNANHEQDAIYEQDRFLDQLFENQSKEIRASSIVDSTKSLVSLAIRLTKSVTQLKNQVSALKTGNSWKLWLGDIATKLTMKSLALLPFGLCWYSVISTGYTGYFSTSSHLAACFLLCSVRSYKSSLLGLLLANYTLFAPSLLRNGLPMIASLDGLKSTINVANFIVSAWITFVTAHKIVGGLGLLLTLIFGVINVFFGRLVMIYTSALSIILSYWSVMMIFSKLLKWSDNRVDIIYQKMHLMAAPFACNQILKLRSVFVKFGQYLGGRADMVPPEWNAILAKLQDDMPADRQAYVRKVVESRLGCKIEEIFYEFDLEPIASASVAQVHVGYLRDDEKNRGAKVAVKIQHEGIVPTMKSDMKAYKRIVRFIAFLNKKFEATLILLNAWEKEMLRELDFRIEADNISCVRKNLRDMKLLSENECDSVRILPIDEDYEETEIAANVGFVCEISADSVAIVPQLIERSIYEDMFMMSFVDGFKVTDTEMMDLYVVDKTALMERIVQLYSVQMLVDGIFNADPHAGNILVNVDNNSGVVRPVLLDFGMVIRLSEKEKLSYCKLLYALSQLSISGLSDAIQEVGYENSQSHIHPERDLEWFAYLLRPTAKRGKSLTAARNFRKRRKEQRKVDFQDVDKDDLDESIKEGRYFKSFPESLIFLFRVIGLIRGLCSLLEVEVDYIRIMSQYARFALLKHHGLSVDGTDSLSTGTPSKNMVNIASTKETVDGGASVASTLSRRQELVKFRLNSLQGRIRKVLSTEFAKENSDLIGIQISCVVNGVEVVDIAQGQLGRTSPGIIDSTTQFPLLDLSALLLSTAVLNLVSDGLLKFSEKVSQHLEEFPMKNVTVGELLLYTSEIKEVVSMTASPTYLGAKEEICSLIFTELCEAESGKKTQNSKPTVFTHVIILQMLVEKVSNIPFEEYWKQQSIPEKGLWQIVSVSRRPKEKAAEASNGFAPFLWDLIAKHFFTPTTGTTQVSGDDSAESKEDPKTIGILGDLELSGIPVDPLMVNSSQLNTVLCPTLGSFSSATGLNTLLEACFKKRFSKDVLLQLCSQSRSVEESGFLGERKWTYGFEIADLGPDLGSRVLLRQGFGGNLFLMCPSKSLFLTILVNNYTLERDVTKQVVSQILSVAGVCDEESAEALFQGVF